MAFLQCELFHAALDLILGQNTCHTVYTEKTWSVASVATLQNKIKTIIIMKGGHTFGFFAVTNGLTKLNYSTLKCDLLSLTHIISCRHKLIRSGGELSAGF